MPKPEMDLSSVVGPGRPAALTAWPPPATAEYERRKRAAYLRQHVAEDAALEAKGWRVWGPRDIAEEMRRLEEG